MAQSTSNLDAETQELLQRFGFDSVPFDDLRDRFKSGALGAASNRIRGEVTPPHEADIAALPAVGTPERRALHAKGSDAIAAGQVGAIILAGGMATRFGGVVKAGVEAVAGKSFFELKVMDLAHAAKEAGGRIPLYPMTSFATDAEVRRLAEAAATPEVPIECFPQLISVRLTPEGEIFQDDEGQVSPHAPGHGDLPTALHLAGILARFQKAGGKYLFMSNVDNLTATLDPAVIGAHIEAGNAVTIENAPKLPGDKGGAPARVDDVPQIVEAFRFPDDFDQDAIPVFNTNTLVFDVDALVAGPEGEGPTAFPLDWFVVTKKVKDQPVIQFERLVGQLSAFLPSTFLRVEREGADARFQPVKDPAELERRKPEITAALQARGIL